MSKSIVYRIGLFFLGLVIMTSTVVGLSLFIESGQELYSLIQEGQTRNNTIQYHTHTERETLVSNTTIVLHEYHDRVNFYPRDFHRCGRRAYEEIITGQSMLQLVDVRKDGSMSVNVEPVSFAELKLGDVIVYEKDNETIFHAITYINKNYARTAGYNNDREDEENVRPEQIIARYCVK